MRAILGGKFENALIRGMDAFNWPDRNRTTHGYYISLNRQTEPSYFERVGTFVAIADEIIVPSADWSDKAEGEDGISGATLGIRHLMGKGLNEWDKAARDFADLILDEKALSQALYEYISEVNIRDLADEDRVYVEKNFKQIKYSVAEHYLCRLFLQLREAGLHKVFLVLDERDILLLSEIRDFIIEKDKFPGFVFPDIDARVILGHEFAGGLFNFAPTDAKSMAAIREDKKIKKYAEKVRDHVADTASIEGERALLDAMRDSYEDVKKARKVDKAFEIAGWVAKPLRYIPGVDAALAIAEDVGDVADMVLDRKRENMEWYLLAARAAEINIEDYLQRKQNR